jgi:hypothetical protein
MIKEIDFSIDKIDFIKINNKREWNALPGQSHLFVQNQAGESFKFTRHKESGNGRGLWFSYRIDDPEAPRPKDIREMTFDEDISFRNGLMYIKYLGNTQYFIVFNLSVE